MRSRSQSNPRGSTGYGYAFTYATRGRWGMEDYQDLMQAVDIAIARAKRGVDTTRMAVLGGSYGGFMTNWIVGHTNRFRVAQTDRSIFNWYSWYGSSDAQGLTEYEFRGAPWESDSLYRVLSLMPSSSSCPCASAPFRRNSCAIRALSTASPAPAPRGCSSIVWNVSARGSRTGSGRARRHQRQLRASTERAPVGFDRPFGRARGRAAECATARDAAATHSDDRL